MVNNADVKALLMRIGGELQAAGPKGSAEAGEQKGISFAASLGAELDAAASGMSARITEKPLQTVKTSESTKPIKVTADGKASDAAEVVLGETGDPGEKPPDISPQVPVVQASDADADKGQLKLPVHVNGTETRPVVAKVLAEQNAKPEESVKPAELESGAKPAKVHAEKRDAAKDEVVAAVQVVPVAVQTVETVSVVAAGAAVSMQQSVQSMQAGAKERLSDAQGPELSNDRALVPVGRKSMAIRPVVAGQTEIVRQKVGTAPSRGEASKVDATKSEESPQVGVADGHEEFPVQRRVAGVADHSTANLATSIVAVVAAVPQQHAASSNTLADGATVARDAGAGVRGQIELRSNDMPAADRTIVATPSTLEVGIANGTHGWLKIRAELTDAGTVTAALSSTTQAGMQVLHRDLPALSSFLDREQVPVSSLVVHQTDSSGFFTGADGSGGRAGGQHPQQGHAQQGATQPLLDAEMGGFPDALPEAQSGEGYSAGGGWLSVRA